MKTVLLSILALSFQCGALAADDFSWPAVSFSELRPSLAVQAVSRPTGDPKLIFVRASPTPTQETIFQCRARGRVSNWTWFSYARERVCGSAEGLCPGLECRQSRWT